MAPKKTIPLPTWADPKQESVFDPLYQTMIKRAVSLSGLDDPQSQVMQAAMPAPLISIYKDRMARSLGTRKFIESAQEFARKNINPHIENAAVAFAKKYPRVAAHMNLNPYAIDLADSTGARIAAQDKVRTPMEMEITRLGNAVSREDPAAAARFIFHEGTHAAQNLGNQDFDQLYNLAGEITPYHKIPYEVTASQAGRRAVSNTMPVSGPVASKAPYKAIRERMPNPEVTRLKKEVDTGLKDWLATPEYSNTGNYRTAELDAKYELLKSAEKTQLPYTATRGLQELANQKKFIVPSQKVAADKLRDILLKRSMGPQITWESFLDKLPPTE